jgi:hypothetical protein
VRQKTLAQFEFDILRASAGKVPLQVNKVGLPGISASANRMPQLWSSKSNIAPTVYPRVSRRVIVCSVVVDGEIQKLEMAIASGRVQVEKIHELEFAQPDFQSSCGQIAEDRQWIALRERAVMAQRNFEMQHRSAYIRF